MVLQEELWLCDSYQEEENQQPNQTMGNDMKV